eukprot:8856847-Heterocapsa_arctica.AAC.1
MPDTRGVYTCFRSPPSTHLPSAALFGAIESDGGKPLYFAVGDLENCFYHLGVPEGLERWFALPGIASHLAGWFSLSQVSRATSAVPSQRQLPTGAPSQ